MKAVIIKKYGTSDVLQISEIEKPEITENEILVKIRAASVNPVDYKIRRGDLKLFTSRKFPKMLGADFSGEIVEIGEKITDFAIGDSVFGMLSATRGGAYAEYVAVEPKTIIRKPENLDFEQAAAIPLAAETALQALRNLGQIKRGDTVLVNGSTGGVGHFAVQIAHAYGAEVTAICSKRNVELSKRLGAEEVVDYKAINFNELNGKYDIIFDVVSNFRISEAKKMLKPKGIYIATLPTPGKIVQNIFSPILGRKVFRIIMTRHNQEDLKELKILVKSGRLEPVIEHRFKLEEIVRAHRQMETGHTRGKIVLII